MNQLFDLYESLVATREQAYQVANLYFRSGELSEQRQAYEIIDKIQGTIDALCNNGLNVEKEKKIN